ncbi:MAG: UvrD-helicase domain-containing protein [candidate division KSB1 bacterium]|nr:UvrD-helicase domain-containing protein [candidate division KSB1 bacterium]
MTKPKTPEWLLNDLNDEQRRAVLHLDGPVLILAGAGSGKTRVLTYRIAHLLASGKARPAQVMAMTFTNKAAGEMRERVHRLIPESIGEMWVGTFHSLFARLLRREADKIGYAHNFSIYDTEDQAALIKTVMEELNISTQHYAPKMIHYLISRAKNGMVMPEEYAASAQNPVEEAAAKVYAEYNRRLRRLNAMDFDDLLIKPLELFRLYPLIKEYYQDRFRYLLVDEYQDTNRAQYWVLRELADKYRNICVVGDDDQSIYRWRGAELRNILGFEQDYPECAKFRLEQNYRSTPPILGLAHSVVSRNTQRHEKRLWTVKQGGEPVSLITVYDGYEEARLIVDKITAEFRKGRLKFGDFAVLYRINAQSRQLEEVLRGEAIPYVIVGGIKFYERKEVKDVLAYLRAIVNPADTVSIKRIINTPARGIGEATIAKIDAFARQAGITFHDALAQAQRIPEIQPRTAEKLTDFYDLLSRYRQLIDQVPPGELASSLVEELRILHLFKEEGTIEAAARAENVRELLAAIHEFTVKNPGMGLEDYMQQVSLITDIDTWNDRADAVTLMTLHAAKGLEFPVVFITGLEEGLFPLSRSLNDPYDLEEERRLFYVGATRAKEKLYLLWAKNRRRYGEGEMQSYKSRFLKELDPQYVVEELSPTLQRAARSTRTLVYPENRMPRYEEESQEPLAIAPGTRVRHNTFGIGTVREVQASSGGAKLLVYFEQHGPKRLVLPFAKLEIL